MSREGLDAALKQPKLKNGKCWVRFSAWDAATGRGLFVQRSNFQAPFQPELVWLGRFQKDPQFLLMHGLVAVLRELAAGFNQHLVRAIGFTWDFPGRIFLRTGCGLSVCKHELPPAGLGPRHRICFPETEQGGDQYRGCLWAMLTQHEPPFLRSWDMCIRMLLQKPPGSRDNSPTPPNNACCPCYVTAATLHPLRSRGWSIGVSAFARLISHACLYEKPQRCRQAARAPAWRLGRPAPCVCIPHFSSCLMGWVLPTAMLAAPSLCNTAEDEGWYALNCVIPLREPACQGCGAQAWAISSACARCCQPCLQALVPFSDRSLGGTPELG